MFPIRMVGYEEGQENEAGLSTSRAGSRARSGPVKRIVARRGRAPRRSVGAGPAGLTAAYLLAKRGLAVTVLESDPRYVGGLSRTVEYKGFHFDIGGHRFFSKSDRVMNWWMNILPVAGAASNGHKISYQNQSRTFNAAPASLAFW